MRSFHLISFIPVLIYFPLPSTPHCCHKCIWQDMGLIDGKHPGVLIRYPDNTRGCSIGCDGRVINDGTCTPGGSQLFCAQGGGLCNMFGCNCTQPCIRHTKCFVNGATPSITKNKASKIFDGTWYGQGNETEIATIQGNFLIWNNGEKNELVYNNVDKTITMIDHEGNKWSARITYIGSLQWNDGKIWTKHKPDKWEDKLPLDVIGLEYVINSLLQNECGEPSILSRFQSKVLIEDTKYTDNITQVLDNVTMNIGKMLVFGEGGTPEQDRIRCTGVWANCFLELPEKTTPFAYCYDDDITNKKHYEIFTFLLQVQLLLSPECKENSPDCSFNDNMDKKTLLRLIKTEFFTEDVGSENKLPTLEDQTECDEPLQRIRSKNFTDYDLPIQIQDIEFVKTKCINQDYENDYGIFIASFGAMDQCLGRLQTCAKATELPNTLELFKNQVLKCDLNEGFGIIPEKEFYSKFNVENKKSIQEIKRLQDKVMEDIYNLMESNITECKEIVSQLDTEYPLIFKLLLATKMSGIYKCEDNCTVHMMSNQNLVLHNIHLMLRDEKIGDMLKTLCNEDNECEKARAEIELDGFTGKPFEKQASTFAFLIEKLIADMERTYLTLTTEHPECEPQIKNLCKGAQADLSTATTPTGGKRSSTISPEKSSSMVIKDTTYQSMQSEMPTTGSTSTHQINISITSSGSINSSTLITYVTNSTVSNLSSTTSPLTNTSLISQKLTSVTPTSTIGLNWTNTFIAPNQSMQSVMSTIDSSSTNQTNISMTSSGVVNSSTLIFRTANATASKFSSTKSLITNASLISQKLTGLTPTSTIGLNFTTTFITTNQSMQSVMSIIGSASTTQSNISMTSSGMTTARIFSSTKYVMTNASLISQNLTSVTPTPTTGMSWANKFTTTNQTSFNLSSISSSLERSMTTPKHSFKPTITSFAIDSSYPDASVYKWFVNEKQYEYSSVEAAIRFHRIDTDHNGFITCEEAFNWCEEPFLGKSFDPQKIDHPYSDASTACKEIEERFNPGPKGQQKWPAMLHENLNPINEIIKDGKIDPTEFDSELGKLSREERNHLMKEILKHPSIHSVG